MPAGAPDPRLLQFLFARQDQERAARAQEQKDQFDQMLALQKADREQKTWELQQANARADLFSKIGSMTQRVGEAQRGAQAASQAMFTLDDLTLGKNGKTLGPEFGALVSELDPTALDQVRFTQAADQNVRNQEGVLAALNQSVAGGSLGNSLGAIRGQAFAGDVEANRQAGMALDKDIAKERRAESAVIRKERRQQQYDIAAEERKRQADANAAVNGSYDFDDLREISKTDQKRLEFAQDVTRDYGLIDRLDMGNAQDIVEMLQRWVRRVDEGATVREGDIQLMRMVGASGIDSMIASAKGWLNANDSFPPGFGEQLRESFRGMLAEEDQKISDIYAGMEEYADGLGLSEKQRRVALPGNKRQAIAARERIAAREAQDVRRTREASTVGAQFPTISRAQFNQAQKLLATLRGVPESSLSAEEVDQFARATGGAMGAR